MMRVVESSTTTKFGSQHEGARVVRGSRLTNEAGMRVGIGKENMFVCCHVRVRDAVDVGDDMEGGESPKKKRVQLKQRTNNQCQIPPREASIPGDAGNNDFVLV